MPTSSASPSVVPVEDRAGLSIEVLSKLRSTLEGLATLEQVLRWGFAERPLCEVAEVITQDEYTHDVVMTFRPPLYLVFDTT